MEQTELSTIDHVAINVADIERSVAWYATSFSCEVLRKTPVFALLKFQNIKLALSLPSQQPPHLALPRGDAQSFGELRPQADGSASAFIADPTGNVVELISDEQTVCV